METVRQQVGNLLVAKPDWKAHYEDRNDLRIELTHYLQQQKAKYPDPVARTVLPIDELANLRFAKELLTDLIVFDDCFLYAYNIEAGQTLSQAIQAAHAEKLKHAIQSAFACSTQEQKLMMASLMEHQVLSWAHVWLLKEESEQVEALRSQHPAVLNMDEALALFDYLDPHTLHFHIVNGGARLKAFWGIDGIAEAGQLLAAPFQRALHKLKQNVHCIDRSGLYYKGFKGQQLEFQHDRLMLDYLVDQNGLLILPHAISTSRIASQSFARIDEREEDAELVIKTASGIDVSLFHGKLGKALGEVLLLPEPLKITRRESEYVLQNGRASLCYQHLRYSAQSMQDEANTEPRWRSSVNNTAT